MGIDEAGRGPVLGPMVYAGVVWKEKIMTNILSNCHVIVDDSKQVSPEEREKTF